MTNLVNESAEFRYRMLGRLQMDLEYYLGHGNRSEKHLWAGSIEEQFEVVQALYDSLDEKPEWLTQEQINDYKIQCGLTPA